MICYYVSKRALGNIWFELYSDGRTQKCKADLGDEPFSLQWSRGFGEQHTVLRLLRLDFPPGTNEDDLIRFRRVVVEAMLDVINTAAPLASDCTEVLCQWLQIETADSQIEYLARVKSSESASLSFNES